MENFIKHFCMSNNLRKTENQKTQEFGWWIEILVDNPACLYYFGAFNNYLEAHLNKVSYVQDLEEEGAELVDIRVRVQRPEQLTINLDNIFTPKNSKEISTKEISVIENRKEFGWWIEILTNNPDYIYYFGAFNSYWEAEQSKDTYIRDLEEERAKIVEIKIEQCQPKQLTIPCLHNFFWF